MKPAQNAMPAPIQAAGSAAPLEGTNWVAIEIGGEAVALAPGQRAPMLSVEAASSRFRGNAGCNQISGALTRSGDNLSFKNVIATRMACPALDLETKFLAALDAVIKYRIEGDVLELLDQSGAVRIRMRAA